MILIHSEADDVGRQDFVELIGIISRIFLNMATKQKTSSTFANKDI